MITTGRGQVVAATCAVALVVLGSLAMVHADVISSGPRVEVLSAALWLAPFPVAYVLARVSAGWQSQLALGALAASVGGVAVLGDVASAVTVGATYSITIALPWLLGAHHLHRMQRHRRHIQSARLAERSTLLSDMHDAIGHDLAVIALHAGSLEIDERQPPNVRATGTQIRTFATEATDRLRTTLRHHHPEGGRPVHAGGLWNAPSVDEMVRQARLTGTDVILTVTPSEAADPGELARAIIREAVTNSLKHAPAEPVEISITVDGARTRVVVTTQSSRPPDTKSGLPTLARQVVGEGGFMGYGRHRETGFFNVDALIPTVPTPQDDQ